MFNDHVVPQPRNTYILGQDCHSRTVCNPQCHTPFSQQSAPYMEADGRRWLWGGRRGRNTQPHRALSVLCSESHLIQPIAALLNRKRVFSTHLNKPLQHQSTRHSCCGSSTGQNSMAQQQQCPGISQASLTTKQFEQAHELGVRRKQLFKEYLSQHEVIETLNMAVESMFNSSELPHDPLKFLGQALLAASGTSKGAAHGSAGQQS